MLVYYINIYIRYSIIAYFAIWGIFSAHLRTMYSPIFGLPYSFFAAKYVLCVFFVN